MNMTNTLRANGNSGIGQIIKVENYGISTSEDEEIGNNMN